MTAVLAEDYRHYQRYFVNIRRFYQRKQVRVYTGIVLSILTVAFFSFFAIRPTLVTIAALLKEIKDKEAIASQLENKVNALNSAQIAYQQVEKDLYLIDEALPLDPNLSLFVRQLEALARRENVTIGSLQFRATTLKGEKAAARADETKTESPQTAREMNFSLAVAGEYNQLKSFLNVLTRLRRLVIIDAFTFQTGKEEGEGLVLNLNAKAYFLTKK